MSKHTPGPWFGMIDGCFADTNWMAENDEASVSTSAPITDGKGQTVALVVGECWDDSELEANACLVAQAPRMFDLLAEARRTLEMWKDVAPAVSLCADIEKVLAEVEGH